ncbi:4994_t:CDS:1, partial [Gigaspora rosea]
ESHLSLGKRLNLILNKEFFSSDDKRRFLSLDKELHLLLD